MEPSLRADMERALERWREVTTPRDNATASVDVSAVSSSTSTSRAWSHADFTARVASFGVASWFAKPLAISPLACARLGWRNTAPDMLQCVSCARLLCMRIDAQLSAAGVEAVAATFAGQLEDSHEDSCPWRHNSSPTSFTMLPVLGPSQVAETLMGRVEKLVEAAKSSSQLHSVLATTAIEKKPLQKILETVGVSTKQELVVFVVKALETEATDESIVLTAAMLAIGGWGLHTEKPTASGHITASCGYCSRYVQLAAEEPVAASPQTVDEAKDDSQEPSAKRRKTTQAEPTPFDPIGAHRWFCPWLAPQRRRDVDDDRLRAVETLLADAKDPQTKTLSITEFVGLPGWVQNAQALKVLGSSTTPSSSKRDPKDALASVQSVLSLPDSLY